MPRRKVLQTVRCRLSKEERRRVAEAIGKEIRNCRLWEGWTQSELGRRSGMRRTNICRLEKGRHLPSLESLILVGRALKMGAAQLVEAEESGRQKL